ELAPKQAAAADGRRTVPASTRAQGTGHGARGTGARRVHGWQPPTNPLSAKAPPGAARQPTDRGGPNRRRPPWHTYPSNGRCVPCPKTAHELQGLIPHG